MKRWATFVGLFMVLAIGVSPSLAERPHGVGASPEITSVEWLDDPTVGEEVLLEVWSVDEHGVITEVVVDWGDGSISFAHAFCVQGDVRGQPHRMLLDHVYEEPGEYTVTVIAISKPRCFAPSGTSRESEEVFVDTLVMP